MAPASVMFCPVTVTAPPVVWRPVALSRPETLTLPPAPPPMKIEPDWPPMVRAWTRPEMLTALRAASRAVAALMMMLPPLALMVPELLISAPLPPAAVGNATCKNPSPEKSSVALSPEPSPTWPSGTIMRPAFDTEPPSSAA